MSGGEGSGVEWGGLVKGTGVALAWFGTPFWGVSCIALGSGGFYSGGNCASGDAGHVDGG